jgi:hypothetical protein
LTKTRKRRAIPNPNKKFILLPEAFAGDNQASENQRVVEDPVVEEEDDDDDNEGEDNAPVRRSRSGRAIKKPRIY